MVFSEMSNVGTKGHKENGLFICFFLVSPGCVRLVNHLDNDLIEQVGGAHSCRVPERNRRFVLVGSFIMDSSDLPFPPEQCGR